nr:MAG TPA: hypothetical protein [Bacteriophage sp.]
MFSMDTNILSVVPKLKVMSLPQIVCNTLRELHRLVQLLYPIRAQKKQSMVFDS